ncbi:class I SAM-dependent methyltransferase [Paenibacillus tritici]|uniref:Class I SAM-dependent methyltransferase n=1 Tax=Paenibacillus tritici TaxID=1873425 RepID=A0ABX2DS70_9BACL|nr:class I SAM-dependent methyltransferase [Paenibacillus tritici]NQX47270.1 class I SAM-dependent methyltransferase [Paenibacillus tritici]
MEYTGERFIPENDGVEIEAEHVHRYKSITNGLKNLKVLDAGCGTGYGSFFMSQFAKEVTGIDISEETIEWCKEHYTDQGNLNFKQASLESLPFEDAEFDCIVNFEVIEHVDANIQNLFLKEAKRVLKSDGILIMSTPNKLIYTDKSGYRNPFHLSEFYPEDFKLFLKQEFENVKIFNQSLHVVSNIRDESQNEKRVRVIQNESIDNEGKYMIALCSNERGVSSPFDLSSVYKYDSVAGINLASLYVSDIDNFYSQEHKQSAALITDTGNNFSLSFDISQIQNKNKFRFDPVENCFCVCNIEAILTDGTIDSIIPLNALKYYKKGFLFMNIDPQFEIKGDFDSATYFTIKGYFKILTQIEISEVVDDLYKQLMEAVNK